MAWRGWLVSALCGAVAGCGTEVDSLPDGGGGGRADGAPAVDSGAGGDGGEADGAPAGDGAPQLVDDDLDGLDDAAEAALATAYLPYLSVPADDGCPLGGLVVRVRPHPLDGTRVHIIYDHLFQDDCGLGGHVGDNEVFAITVDPALPAPQGIRAIKAISHQNTACERVSECGQCGGGQAACDVAAKGGVDFPVVYTSKDKHAGYATLASCNPILTCLDSCSLAPASATPPIVNAGEPGAHLVENLTTQGFITAANGWTKPELQNANPWDPTTDFGSAGNIAGDLVDPAFDTPLCP